MQILKRQFKNFRGLLLLLLIGGFFSCSDQDAWYFNEGGTLLWVNGEHSDKAIKNAIKYTLDHSSIIVAQISWSPDDKSFFHNTNWYYSLAKNHGKSFMINVDWQKSNRSGTEGGWSFKDPEVVNLFKKDMTRLVKTYKPNYLNLGVEANYYALTSPSGFKSFVGLFRELKTDLKKFNSKLKVGLSYQLELLYGHHEGWNQDKTLTTLDVIYGDIDFLGISTYPNKLEGKDNDVLLSTNFIDSLAQKYSMPLGISETAISSNLYDDNQRELYINAIFEKAKKLNLKFMIWGSMIDAPQDLDWPDRMGLLDVSGNPKKEFAIWKTKNEFFFK